LRLLYVINGAVFGGAHNQAVRLTPLLGERGWDTVVVLPDEQGDALGRLRANGIDVVTVPLDRLRMTPDVRSQARLLSRFRAQVSNLSRLLRERQADIAQLPGVTSPQSAVAARTEGVAVVWQLLDTRPPQLLRRAAMPVVRRLADVVMTTGVEVARHYPGTSALGDRWVPFVPPVDPAEFRPDDARRLSSRAVLGVDAAQAVIGTVGNRNPQKGHEYLIRAMSMVRDRHPEAVLRARGNTSPVHSAYEAKLQRELGAAGLDATSLDRVDDGMGVAGTLPGFDIFVLSSVPRSEGLPTAIVEAMACGLPVVATDVGGVRELVDDGKTGYVVPPRDHQAIGTAISRLLADPELRSAFGRRARQRMEQRWSLDSCVDAHLRAYEIALAHHARRPGSGS
jgi:glycosyltransferase involved in cell wall biosynthesis